MIIYYICDRIFFQGFYVKIIQTFFILISTIVLFTGCEITSPFSPSEKELALKEKALVQEQSFKEKKFEQEQSLKQKELEAKIEQEKNALKVKKDLELAKINTALEKEKIQTQNKEKENTFKLQSQQQTNALEIQRYYIILAGFVLLIISAALFVYFNNRRKDKLKAYEDNLEKYFRQKENQARIEVANKIIDTIASGKLNQGQEQRLLSTINGNSEIAKESIKKIDEEQVMELEVIEHDNEIKKKEEKEKKKKKKEKEKKKK